ncbi:SDR family oxidoreductase [uncultured Roseobacter sp.]|uniref:SDR family oxidoreductase n=1 Tax=uncultured Roseobacter sp. TaxID=114847 RepID=UPI002614F8F4|nr:SDR family oxidoreductase [uncultured Roseobacter sp.]
MVLKGKSIIITGASSGIGAAAARLFAQSGGKVTLGARRGDRLAALVDEITQAGGKAVCLDGDVGDAVYAEELVSLAETAFGGLDAAFNNAGVTGDMGPLPEMAEATWHQVLATNLTSGFFAAKHQIPALRRRGRGSIVFTSSFVGHTIGLPGMAAYASAKAGLIGLAQVLAAEHGPEGIRVNALLPGGTNTEMAGDDPEAIEWIKGLLALKRMAEPLEIAQAAQFLISDQASFVTGTAMIADGGNSINKT